MSAGTGLDRPTTPDLAYGTELLADGSVAVVRPVVPSDRDALRRLHRDASDSSIYYRFFSINRSIADTFVDHVCEPSETTWSVVAERRGSMVGLATASLDQDCDAEVALLVADQAHGLGIGTVLLERLAEWSRRRGVRTFTAEVLASNVPMLRVFHDAGFALTQHRDHDVVDVRLDITPSRVSQNARDTRWRLAEHRSLTPLLEPSTVAVLGVSRRRGGVGREVLANLVAGGFGGDLYAVGRPGLDLEGVHCVENASDLPRDLDLVVVAVAAGDVESTLLDVAQRGARTAVILTAGLGEASETGRQSEARLRNTGARYSVRLVGPNCFGVVSNLRGTRLDATFGRSRAKPGGLAIGSQSGGVGVAILEAVHQRGAGLACFVSLGNKVDVSGNDLLAAWRDDPDITAVGLYLESFHDPRRFVRVAADFSRRKPLLVAFGGTSPAGLRAGKSHTAASATPDRALSAMMRASGAIRVGGVGEMVDTCALLTEQPLPRGPRVALLSNAGGLGILAAETAQRSGLVVPDLADGTEAQLPALLPHASSTTNPVDLGAAADAGAFGTGLHALSHSDDVDAVLVVVVGTAVTDLAAVCAAVETAAGSPESRGAPVLSVVVGEGAPATTASCRFSSVESAIAALVHAVDYGTWLRQPDSGLPSVVPDTGTGAPESTGTEGWLDAADAAQLLSGARPHVATAASGSRRRGCGRRRRADRLPGGGETGRR